jgi:hypothetical protein
MGAVVLAIGLAVAGCGGGGGDATVPPDATAAEVAELAGFGGVHSGAVAASLFITKLKTKEALSMSVTGRFKHLAEGDLPQLFVTAESQGDWNGRSVDFSSLLLLHSHAGWIRYGLGAGERHYRIEPSTVEGLGSKLEQAEGGAGDVGACLRAIRETPLAPLVRNPKIEGRREEGDGTKVVLVAGEIVIARLRSLLVRLARDPGCGAQMRALGLPSAPQLEVARVDFHKGVKGAGLTLAVDKHGVVRELTTRFECARLNGEFFELQLDFGLSEVNRPIEVSGSTEGEPLDNLLRKFGTTEEALLRADGDELAIALLEGIGGAMAGRSP